MLILVELFIAFFLIGLFTFGGGYAMIPMIQETVLEKGWMESIDQIYEFIGIAEATPGPFAVNIATFIGYQQFGILGSAFATLGVITPSFIIILIIAWLGDKFLKTPLMQNALKGIRPIVIGLILSVAVGILYKNLFMVELDFSNLYFNLFDYKALIIIAIAFILCFAKIKIKGKVIKINPIVLILICGVMGLILYTIL